MLFKSNLSKSKNLYDHIELLDDTYNIVSDMLSSAVDSQDIAIIMDGLKTLKNEKDNLNFKSNNGE